ncbi:MAG: S-methyl-5-thioribose-1-phosphate isomerase [Candidatus Calescibacterium sp.]|nr:S-methyl-5-thioribose-1-phosphate isomerase [Candidatus Calescibacterium sp.]MCX7734276.1 S-methyl-5-thioribose-1-phosphate isomerase [bacterium]MDW8087107.1 S-methyl-5-thioribose-1-phosphate isomerase [Candidatus Calescibacterium sp.]
MKIEMNKEMYLNEWRVYLKEDKIDLDKIKKIFYEETEGVKKWIWFELSDSSIKFLDQRFLPHSEKWVECFDENDVALAIRSMVVRGAPAIGISAAFGILYGIRKRLENRGKVNFSDFEEMKHKLLNTRPTAYNLKKAIDDMQSVFVSSSPEDVVEKMEQKAKEIWFYDYLSCYLIGENGSELIPDGGYVFTICNTGALATGGWGTAFSVIRTAKLKGKNFTVYSLETRPYLQGSRLTAWEFLKNKIDFRIIVDSSATFLMSKHKNSCVITGADRILRDGTTSNKIGTLMLAVSSHYFSIPFYVCAPKTTIDPNSESIPIEQRSDVEVKEIFGVKIAPDDAKALNYSFDITPPELITAIITEDGVFRYPYFFG